MWRAKSFGLLAIIFIMFGKISMLAYATDEEMQEEKKIIYFIYDNSKSMQGELPGQEQYAVQMFGAMSNPQDEINIYYVSQFIEPDSQYKYIANKDDEKPQIYLNQSDKEQFFEEIQRIPFDGEHTYFSSIIRAVNDIKSKPGKKWVVMFTDGLIEKSPNKEYDGEDLADLNSKLQTLLSETDVNLYFSSLLGESIIEQNERANIHTYAIKNGDSVIDCILSASEVIYGKRKQVVSVENEVVTINFDIPVSDFVLLIQSDKEAIEIEDANLLSHKLYDISASDGRGEMPPYGFIAEFKIDQAEYESRDDYEISFNIPKDKNYNIDIYYTPMVKPTLQIYGDADGVKAGRYVEGGYSVEVEWLNPETGQPVNTNALLLSAEKCSLIIDGNSIGNFDWKAGYVGSAGRGETEFVLQTTLGDVAPKKVVFEKSFKDYRLELGGAEDIFYYNRLDKKENFFWMEMCENDINITDEAVEPVVKFYQNGVENEEMEGELEFDLQKKRWNIYPVLKNPPNLDISGDLVCEVSVILEADYYETPKVLQEDIVLKMGVEDELFKATLAEKILQRNYIFPFIGDWIKVDYIWDGAEADTNRLEEEYTVWRIYQDGELIESQEKEHGSMHIPWRLSYLLKEPDRIEIEAEAEYVAYGEKTEADLSELIVLEGMQMWEKIICWGIIVGFMVMACFLLRWLISYVIVIKKRERFWRCPKVSRNAAEVWDFGNVKWRWKRKKIFLGGYYLVTLSMPFYTEYQELKMKLCCRNGSYQITVLGLAEQDIEMYIDGGKIDMRNAYVFEGQSICVCNRVGDKIYQIKIEER